MAEKKGARREPVRPGKPRTLSPGWAAAVLALLTVAFFHEVALEGKTFVSPDALAPAGFVRIGEQSLGHDHVYPLWNPFVFLGMPSFGSGMYNPFIYPPDWPLALIQKVVALPDMIWMLLYYFLGGLALFLLAREWGARAEGALIGAAAFVFAPNLVAVGSHGHGSQLVDSAYLPLMLWLATRWMRRGRLADLGWLAVAGGFQLLRGHVQICFYTWVAIGLYVAVEWALGLQRRDSLPTVTMRAVAVAAAAALAFGVSGFYTVPLRDYARWSIRGGGEGGGVGMEYATQWSLAPYELPTMVVPGWVGFGGQTYWGGMPFTDYPNAYVGMVVALLALVAFAARPPADAAPRLFALALAVFALLVSFGRHFPLYGFLYQHLPLFNKFRVPVMVVLLLGLAAALGAAWGASAALEPAAVKGRRDPIDRLILVAGAVLGIGLLAATVGRDAWRAGYVALAMQHRQPYLPELADAAYRGFVSSLAVVSLLGLAALAALWLARRGRLGAGAAGAALLVLVLIELWPVSGRVMKPVIGDAAARTQELGRDDVVEFLEHTGPPGSFRILPLEEFQSNRFAGFGIASLGGYHAAKPRLIQDFFDAGLQDDPRWIRLLNVRYIVTQKALESLPPFLKLVYQGSGVVYENLSVLPRATVVGSWRVASPAKAILDSVRAGTHDAAELAWLEKDPGIPSASVAGAVARIESYRLNDAVVEVDTPAPALLRLADLWYPDWSATVDGRRVEVLKADYLLRAVAVPQGRHRVAFRFESRALRNGLVLSLASLAAALALLAADRFLRRSAARAAAPAGAP
ncbi:MAG TPA: hypothetical protein VGK89_11085 [Candidatus Eisenbacteria bacterium]|jgi:hypothetical protein